MVKCNQRFDQIGESVEITFHCVPVRSDTRVAQEHAAGNAHRRNTPEHGGRRVQTLAADVGSYRHFVDTFL